MADESGARRKAVDRWMGKAFKKETEGDFTAWCKRQGYSGVCQSCISKAASVGGHAGRMALAAVNANPGKYHWPKKQKK